MAQEYRFPKFLVKHESSFMKLIYSNRTKKDIWIKALFKHISGNVKKVITAQ